MQENEYDYLGTLYMEINMNSKYKGKYFTPPHMCNFMAELIIVDKADFDKTVEEKGYFGVSDPCCGSGSLAVATIKTLKSRGIEDIDAKALFVLQDIDLTCVQMAYINMCLLGVSAKVIYGNTLIIDENYPFFDTPCLQIRRMIGLFQGKENKEEAKESKENSQTENNNKSNNEQKQQEVNKQPTLFDMLDNRKL